MANSNWASKNLPVPPAASPTARPVGSAKVQAHNELKAAFTPRRNSTWADKVTAELELTDGCEACFAWVFGSGLACEQHDEELRALRS